MKNQGNLIVLMTWTEEEGGPMRIFTSILEGVEQYDSYHLSRIYCMPGTFHYI